MKCFTVILGVFCKEHTYRTVVYEIASIEFYEGQIFIQRFAVMWTPWKVSVFWVCLVRIFLDSDWTRRDTPHLSVFSPNAGKYELEKLQIRTLFTHAVFCLEVSNCWKLRIWSHLQKKSLMENFVFCAVIYMYQTGFRTKHLSNFCSAR